MLRALPRAIPRISPSDSARVPGMSVIPLHHECPCITNATASRMPLHVGTDERGEALVVGAEVGVEPLLGCGPHLLARGAPRVADVLVEGCHRQAEERERAGMGL